MQASSHFGKFVGHLVLFGCGPVLKHLPKVFFNSGAHSGGSWGVGPTLITLSLIVAFRNVIRNLPTDLLT